MHSQTTPFPYEIVVCDDSPLDNEVKQLCERWNAKHIQLNRHRLHEQQGDAPVGKPFNEALKHCRGNIVVLQSGDVEHCGEAVTQLVEAVTPQTFVLAKVTDRASGHCFCGPLNPKPFFFLGVIHRKHICAVGGYDETFPVGTFTDNWLADCLMQGLGLQPVFSDTIIGYHQPHPRPRIRSELSEAHYENLHAAAELNVGEWKASHGSWPYVEGKSVAENSVLRRNVSSRIFNASFLSGQRR